MSDYWLANSSRNASQRQANSKEFSSSGARRGVGIDDTDDDDEETGAAK